MLFKNRKNAGKKLSGALANYKNKRVLVLAIQRGGVQVGYEVAKYLKAKFSLVISRMLPYPGNPEACFGAVTEDGTYTVLPGIALPEYIIDRIKSEQLQEAKKKAELFRNNPLPRMNSRIVILVDDGSAMGATMHAAIKMIRMRNPSKIIVAAPISVKEMVFSDADEVVILEKSKRFYAVAQAYDTLHDISDKEVIDLVQHI